VKLWHAKEYPLEYPLNLRWSNETVWEITYFNYNFVVSALTTVMEVHRVNEAC